MRSRWISAAAMVSAETQAGRRRGWNLPEGIGRETAACGPGRSTERRSLHRCASVRRRRRPTLMSCCSGRAGRLPEVLRCAHFTAEDLAGRALGQIGRDPDVTRVFVGCYPVLHERAQFVGGGGSARLELHGGGDFLAEMLIRDSDDGGFGYGWMLVDDLFDLARVHVESAADDHVLLPVHDVEIAVLVDSGQVAGLEPAAGDRLGRGARVAPVSLHHVVTADDDLADLPDGQFGAFVVDYAHLDSLDRR